jgi:ribosomal protein L11 methyltransferase
MLDVGTGSGILALAALEGGAGRVVAVDRDARAIGTAAANAALNRLSSRLLLIRGGPEALSGRWPLVVANILAAPLIELAPALVQRLASGGRLVLSGIPGGVASDVAGVYTGYGLRLVGSEMRAGWCALTLQTTW